MSHECVRKMIPIHKWHQLLKLIPLLSVRLKLKSSYIKTFIHLQSESFMQSVLHFPALVSITSDRLKLAFSFERHPVPWHPNKHGSQRDHCKVKYTYNIFTYFHINTQGYIIILNLVIWIERWRYLYGTEKFCHILGMGKCYI